MDDGTARALCALNQRFYRDAARDFSAARAAPWPGWERLLPLLAGEPLEILDAGCGNGRFPAFLCERNRRFDYLGLDASEPLLAEARARPYPGARVAFQHADLFEDPDAALPSRGFGLIALFGILHHVPGRERRRRLLRALAARLAPGGLLALTEWRFEASERFLRRVRPWSEWSRWSEGPLDLAALEPGDHLLPWGDEGAGARYCHFAREPEAESFLVGLPVRSIAAYASDGREGNLNRYTVFRAESSGS